MRNLGKEELGKIEGGTGPCFLYGLAFGFSVFSGNVVGIAASTAGAISAGCFDEW